MTITAFSVGVIVGAAVAGVIAILWAWHAMRGE